MTRTTKWPTEAKLTIAGLVVLILVIAAIRFPDADKTQSAQVKTTSTLVSSTTTPGSTTTRLPTTTVAAPTPSVTAQPPTSPPTTAAPIAPPPAPAPSSSVTALLDGLPVTTKDSSRPYKRAQDFGPAWADDNDMVGGHNGCDTRNDILRRDLTNIQVRPGTRDCVVIAGTFADPYSGTMMTFAKAQASQIQIDHVIPLHAAWQLGAWQWPQQKRVNYANDPDVLVASNGRLNQQKSDKLVDEWKPPNSGYWCTYATKTVNIHVKYALPVTTPEGSALHEMLATCW